MRVSCCVHVMGEGRGAGIGGTYGIRELTAPVMLVAVGYGGSGGEGVGA